VDVSAQRTVIEVARADARDLLLKGCALDLHPRVFGVGRCAQTLLARAQVVLVPRTDEPAYRVFVRASFAEYLAEWLLDAAAEYREEAPLNLSLQSSTAVVAASAA
jgi:sarcosine oxidase subunit gamma